MNKVHGAVALIALIAVCSIAALAIFKAVPSPTPEDFNIVDGLLDQMDDYMGFENQDFDYGLGEISGDWE